MLCTGSKWRRLYGVVYGSATRKVSGAITTTRKSGVTSDSALRWEAVPGLSTDLYTSGGASFSLLLVSHNLLLVFWPYVYL